MSGKVKVYGADELNVILRAMPSSMVRAVLRPAARDGTKAPRQHLKRTAPRQSGALRKAMTSKVSTNVKKNSVSGTIGPNRKYAVKAKGGKGFVSGRTRVAKVAKSADDVIGIRPSRYAHLAGKGRTGDYMAEAQAATQKASLDAFTARARVETAKQAAKLAAKKKK
jgi:hypothetical protein